MSTFKISALAIVATMLTGCLPEAQIPSPEVTLVDTYTVGESVDSRYRQLQGVVVPADLTPLSFRVEGKVSSVHVKPGARIKKGDLIAQLDDTKLKQKLDDALAQFNLTTNQLERSRKLAKKNMISPAQLDELAANQELTKVQYLFAKKQLSYTKLVAPFDGVIAEVPIERYENVSPAESVAILYHSGEVYIDIAVSDSFLATFKASGNYPSYQPKADIGTRVKGAELSYLEHSAEPLPTTQAYLIRYSLKQTKRPILPGQSVNIEIDLAALNITNRKAFTLPMNLLQPGSEPHQFYIWKLVDNKAHQIEVQVNQISTLGAHITDGVVQDDVLISTRINTLREGMKVKTVAMAKEMNQGASQ